MTISSRSPDGAPNRCPVCGNRVRIAPSDPAGDAPCPHCGVLLWFVARDSNVYFFERQRFRIAPISPQGGHESAKIGSRVRVSYGAFENFEGEVTRIDRSTNRLSISIHLFGRPTPIELEPWQVEPV
jgi:hypothetical protein